MATPPLDPMEGLERASHTDTARSDPSPGHGDLFGLMGRSATRAAAARCNALERKGAEIRGMEANMEVSDYDYDRHITPNKLPHITPNKLPEQSCTDVQLYITRG